MDCHWWEMHGRKGKKTWAPPTITKYVDTDARPGYNTMKAHEYCDDADVLRQKIRVLAEMIQSAKNATAYTGAGISTSSGIADYASKGGARGDRPRLMSPLDAMPTLAHRTLTEL